MDYASPNNNDRGYIEVREIAFYRSPWLVLYSVVLAAVFVAGGMVASRFSRKIEPVHVDIAIADQNIQQAVDVKSVKDVPMLGAAVDSSAYPSGSSVVFDDSSRNGAVNSSAVVNSAKNAPVIGSAKSLAITIKAKDSLGKIFKRVGVDAKGAATILALKQAKPLRDLVVGKRLNLVLDPAVTSGVKRLTYEINDLTTIELTFSKNSWQVQTNHIKPISAVKYVSTMVNGSIYAAGKKAGIPRKLMDKFIGLFSSKVNFNKLRHGDRLALFYEERTANGKKVGGSDIVAAELIHGGKTHRIIGFGGSDGHKDFYTPDGRSLKSSFVRYPVENFRRIGSKFSPGRLHPILGIVRPHLGVDIDAPAGTPVKATSNGKVTFMGYHGGHGRTVIIKNGAYSTLYAHLLRFPKDIHAGEYVRQGRVIGFIGSSGLATGPHLHYEFRINGVHHDPLKVKLPDGEMIAAEHRSRFFALAKKMVAQLELRRKDGRMFAMADGNSQI